MEKFDKILELIEKNSLSEEEQMLLKQSAESDEEIKSFIKVYRKLNSSLSAPGHIPADLLAAYVLFEKGDDSECRIVALLADKIKSHLSECPRCKSEYNNLLREYSEINEYIANSIKQELPEKVKQREFFLNSLFRQRNVFRYAFVASIVLIVSYFGLFFISAFVTPEYKMNLFQDEHGDSYKTRGRISSLFQQGLNAIEEGDYSKAISYLSEDIQKHPDDKSIFYSHYVIAITYLKASQSDFIGLFRSYDRENVNLAIANLKESIDKNNSGDYESLKLDSFYYLGRAYLLIEEPDSAISNFRKVIDGKGRFSKEAADLVVNLVKS
jgi:tetratricopeptide (TPR) repeat protein